MAIRITIRSNAPNRLKKNLLWSSTVLLQLGMACIISTKTALVNHVHILNQETCQLPTTCPRTLKPNVIGSPLATGYAGNIFGVVHTNSNCSCTQADPSCARFGSATPNADMKSKHTASDFGKHNIMLSPRFFKSTFIFVPHDFMKDGQSYRLPIVF
jgi:hypothetical protein